MLLCSFLLCPSIDPTCCICCKTLPVLFQPPTHEDRSVRFWLHKYTAHIYALTSHMIVMQSSVLRKFASNLTECLLIVQGGHVTTSPSVKEGHQVMALFQLPSLTNQYRSKADEYLSHLVGHEGKGSLLSALKAKGWASELSAGVGE